MRALRIRLVRILRAKDVGRTDVDTRLALALLACVSVLTMPAAEASWQGGASSRKVCAAFSPDGRSLAVCDGKRTIRIWDVATRKEGKETTIALALEEVPEQISFNSRGDLVVLLYRYKGFESGAGWSKQGTISTCLWNVAAGKRSPFIKIGYSGMAACWNGELLAYDRGLWDVATGKKLRNVAVPDGLIIEINFSPDGKRVLYRITESLAQDFALLFLADVATGKKVLQIGEIDLEKNRGKCSFLFGPKFSADGSRIAFGEADRPALHLWDVPGAKALHSTPLKELESVLGFSPDGRTLVTWRDADGDLHRWDTATGKHRLAANVGTGLDAVLLSPDGKTLALRKGTDIKFRDLKD